MTEYIEREAAKRELLFWAVLAVSVAGATLSDYIEARKRMIKEADNE